MIRLILSLLFTTSVYSSSYKFSGKSYDFKVKDKIEFGNCKDSCIAIKKLKMIKDVDLKELRSKAKFASSVGSDVCHLKLSGKSILAKASNGDMRALCVFEDNSMIEINSITNYFSKK